MLFVFFFLRVRRPPRSTRTDTLFPYTTLFRAHAVAVVIAIIPNLAQWATGLIDNALSAAGTTAGEVGYDSLDGAGVVYEGLKALGEGAELVGLVLGTKIGRAHV